MYKEAHCFCTYYRLKMQLYIASCESFFNYILYLIFNKSYNTNKYINYVDPDDPYKLNQDTRMLGLVVCRGTSVVLICPVDGMESIQNPFIQQEG